MKQSKATKKLSAKEKRILIGALCIAAVTVAGGTFAWFTSKDEVTNRLSANAAYDVSIAEDFTPPENWIPGQTINKDVGAVNTGNIDAIVRMHLEGAMNVLKENAVDEEIAVSELAELEDVTDASLIALGLTKKDSEGNYYRTLSTVERTNPNASSTDNDTNESDGAAIENSEDEDNNYSEVEAVQAGGWLAYASGDFTFTPESAGYTYRNAADDETIIQTTAAALESTDIKDTWTNGEGLAIDSDTFVPTSSGLFIFRRNITTDDEEGHDYEFTGYYAVVSGDTVTYYALHYLPDSDTYTPHSDCVIYSTAEDAQETDGTVLDVVYDSEEDKSTPIISVTPDTVKLFSASYIRLENLVGTFDDDENTVTFTNGEEDEQEIIVIVNLDNIGEDAEEWTAVPETDRHTYFYYNNDVEEGDSTSKLVDSVKLADDTDKRAYYAFDFDLSVLLDSIQITIDESGNELMPGATGATSDENEAAPWDPGAVGTATLTENEISSISWEAAT